MADPSKIIRNASLYFKGKKFAECEKATLTMKTGAEQHPADGIVLTSQGMPTSQLRCDALTPFAGSDVDGIILDAYESGDSIPFRWGVDGGRIMQMDVTLDTTTRDADMAKGQERASYEFFAGKPKIVSI